MFLREFFKNAFTIKNKHNIIDLSVGFLLFYIVSEIPKPKNIVMIWYREQKTRFLCVYLLTFLIVSLAFGWLQLET